MSGWYVEFTFFVFLFPFCRLVKYPHNNPWMEFAHISNVTAHPFTGLGWGTTSLSGTCMDSKKKNGPEERNRNFDDLSQLNWVV